MIISAINTVLQSKKNSSVPAKGYGLFLAASADVFIALALLERFVFSAVSAA